jgi:hypothetical protein
MSNIKGGNNVEHSLEISWNGHVQHLKKKENSIEKILNVLLLAITTDLKCNIVQNK